MWTLFNRRKGAEGDSPAATSASAAVAADISHLPSKIPVEARPIDDTKEGPRQWPVTMRFPSMGSERWSLDEGERRSLSASSADAAAAADTVRRASTDGAAAGRVARSGSFVRFDLDHVYTNWPSA